MRKISFERRDKDKDKRTGHKVELWYKTTQFIAFQASLAISALYAGLITNSGALLENFCTLLNFTRDHRTISGF